ncbi:MAG: hypothetical protein GX607_21220 [Myxococcales bacterium]|jgi:hypothetical protein|nr:hypothetical protein [Myxococcales bacterium]
MPKTRGLPPSVLVLAALVGLGAPTACGGNRAEDVTIAPALAATPRAQRELRALESAWEAASVRQRGALAPRLEAFIRRHPADPGTHRARVLLAWVQLEAGQLDQATETLAPALGAPEGRTRDHARLVEAAIVTRRGRPEEALAILQPLQGKLVGRETTRLYGRERTRAALEARRWRLLVTALTEWLEESSEAAAPIRRSAARSLAQVPSHALVRLLEERRAEPARKPSDAERWMERAITEQLARSALQNGDARLARQLLEIAPTWLRTSSDGEQLVLLARAGMREARVEGRTLGVVLQEGDAQVRRRSAEVVAGVIEALDMGRAAGDAPLRLLVREDRGNMAATLATLTGEGASVLVAGVDELGALVGLAFAEERGVPVMVLTDPGEAPAQLGYGFVVGASAREQRALLDAELKRRGIDEVKLVGPGGFPCDARPPHPGAARFPVPAWAREGIGGALLMGDAQCAREVIDAANKLRSGFGLGLGLEASELLFEIAPAGAVGVAAGMFPGGAESASAPWYDLLGRDAARLARAALSVLPENTDVDGEAVRAHLERARDALRSARTPLETTDADGFGGTQRLARQLRIAEAPAARGAR